MSLSDHQRMVADGIRVKAYRDAIRAAVKPGDVVVDIGTGTGLLAVFAAQAGAKRVYAMEWGSVHRVAQDVAKANGLGDVITVLQGDSRKLSLPEPADWVISELMGSFGLEENLMGVLMDARRWLKPTGQFLPERLHFRLAPVMAPQTEAGLSFWETVDLGVDLRPVAASARADLQRADPADLTLLADAGLWQTVVPATLAAPHLSGSLTFPITAAGVCHGFAGWFEAELAGGVTLRNGPTDPATHWGCAYLSLDAPLAVTPGDTVTLDLKVVTVVDSITWTWRWDWNGRRQGAGGSDDLWASLAAQVAAPGASPAGLELTPDGQMTATVLAAVGTGRTEGEVVALLHAEGGAFADVATARRWVRKTVSRYGRPIGP